MIEQLKSDFNKMTENLKFTNDCLIGYSGTIGKHLCSKTKFKHKYNSKNIEKIINKKFNTIICCAAPGAMTTANKKPDEDLRNIKNLKLANQMLKIKRKAKAKQDQANQQANIAAQGQSQADTAEKTAMAEVQKQEAIMGANVQFEQSKNQMEIQRMEIAAQLKAQEMQTKFQFDMQLKQLEVQNTQQKEGAIEDRKDTRSKMEASQQSELISQRQNDSLPIDFENQPDTGMQAFM